jgi:hypothetical protein
LLPRAEQGLKAYLVRRLHLVARYTRGNRCAHERPRKPDW